MALTESRIRQIIREEAKRVMESMDDEPAAKWDRLQGMEKKYRRGAGLGGIDVGMRFGDKLDAVAEVAMEVIEASGVDPAELTADPGRAPAVDLYDKFARAFRKKYEKALPRDPNYPYAPTKYKMEISDYGLHDFWVALLNADLDLDALKRDYATMRELRSEFETADISDQTDYAYGRKTHVTRHKATGTRVGLPRRDREGSLGG